MVCAEPSGYLNSQGACLGCGGPCAAVAQEDGLCGDVMMWIVPAKAPACAAATSCAAVPGDAAAAGHTRAVDIAAAAPGADAPWASLQRALSAARGHLRAPPPLPVARVPPSGEHTTAGGAARPCGHVRAVQQPQACSRSLLQWPHQAAGVRHSSLQHTSGSEAVESHAGVDVLAPAAPAAAPAPAAPPAAAAATAHKGCVPVLDLQPWHRPQALVRSWPQAQAAMLLHLRQLSLLW